MAAVFWQDLDDAKRLLLIPENSYSSLKHALGMGYLEATALCLHLKLVVSAVEQLPPEAQVHKHRW